jgi:predicted RecB family nuclease
MNEPTTPMTPITASMLYDLVSCPHRVTMDLFADPEDRDDVSPFVQLLWERGFAHEQSVMDGLTVPFLDLSAIGGDEKERQTLAAMDRGEPLIYSGRISADGLLGVPDLLRKEEGGYVAGDIKSGAGEEGGTDDNDGKPKRTYGVQLALYTDILERLGRSGGRRGFIWDVHRDEVPYDFNAARGAGDSPSLWDEYQESLVYARGIVAGVTKTLPAYSAVCKNCVWFSTCVKTLEKANDLTLIPSLGRSMRDTLADRIGSIREFADITVDGFITANGKKTIFPRISPDRLRKLHARAKLLAAKDGKPYLRETVALPYSDRQLFFDIEVDPMRNVCYLHGFVERCGGDDSTERFVAFFADDESPEAEEKAFAEAWAYMQASNPCTIYYYSKYERTIYRKLRAKYPQVCSESDIEALFAPTHAVDLYFDVVLKATEWPTRDFSIKTIAKHLGFQWRDAHPSGAASIEWFHRWVTSRDPDIRQRILDYNEDDCRATRVLLDGIRALTFP